MERLFRRLAGPGVVARKRVGGAQTKQDHPPVPYGLEDSGADSREALVAGRCLLGGRQAVGVTQICLTCVCQGRGTCQGRSSIVELRPRGRPGELLGSA